MNAEVISQQKIPIIEIAVYATINKVMKFLSFLVYLLSKHKVIIYDNINP